MFFNPSQTQADTRARGFQEIHTVLGEGTRWQGDLHVGTEGLRIEGTVEGTLLSEGDVLVAPGGFLKGTVEVRSLTVGGRVEGVVRVADCLAIQRTGWLEGEVEMGSLVVDEGGMLQGTCMPHPAVPEHREPEALHPRRDERFPERSSTGLPAQPEPLLPAKMPDKPRF